MSVEREILRLAALIHAMRSRYQSRVYSRAIAFSTRDEPGLYRQVDVVAEGWIGFDGFDNVAGELAEDGWW